MPAAKTTRQNGIILAVLLFAQLLLVSGSVRESGGAARLESWVMRLSSPAVGLAEALSGGFDASVGGVRDLVTAHSRNKQLRGQVERLRTEARQLREASLENARLRRLLEMRERVAPESIGASVVSSIITDRMRMIVVDRGARHGVRTDLAVVAWGGAVGRVVAADATHAKVLLLSDANSGVAGIVQRSRTHGMVVGRSPGPPDLDLRYVPRFSDVMHGDRVVTSGLDGIFPRGFGVGTVIAVRPTADGSQTIFLNPELDFSALEEVLILLDRPDEQAANDAVPEDEP